MSDATFSITVLAASEAVGKRGGRPFLAAKGPRYARVFNLTLPEFADLLKDLAKEKNKNKCISACIPKSGDFNTKYTVFTEEEYRTARKAKPQIAADSQILCWNGDWVEYPETRLICVDDDLGCANEILPDWIHSYQHVYSPSSSWSLEKPKAHRFYLYEGAYKQTSLKDYYEYLYKASLTADNGLAVVTASGTIEVKGPVDPALGSRARQIYIGEYASQCVLKGKGMLPPIGEDIVVPAGVESVIKQLKQQPEALEIAKEKRDLWRSKRRRAGVQFTSDNTEIYVGEFLVNEEPVWKYYSPHYCQKLWLEGGGGEGSEGKLRISCPIRPDTDAGLEAYLFCDNPEKKNCITGHTFQDGGHKFVLRLDKHWAKKLLPDVEYMLKRVKETKAGTEVTGVPQLWLRNILPLYLKECGRLGLAMSVIQAFSPFSGLRQEAMPTYIKKNKDLSAILNSAKPPKAKAGSHVSSYPSPIVIRAGEYDTTTMGESVPISQKQTYASFRRNTFRTGSSDCFFIFVPRPDGGLAYQEFSQAGFLSAYPQHAFYSISSNGKTKWIPFTTVLVTDPRLTVVKDSIFKPDLRPGQLWRDPATGEDYVSANTLPHYVLAAAGKETSRLTVTDTHKAEATQYCLLLREHSKLLSQEPERLLAWVGFTFKFLGERVHMKIQLLVGRNKTGKSSFTGFQAELLGPDQGISVNPNVLVGNDKKAQSPKLKHALLVRAGELADVKDPEAIKAYDQSKVNIRSMRQDDVSVTRHFGLTMETNNVAGIRSFLYENDIRNRFDVHVDPGFVKAEGELQSEGAQKESEEVYKGLYSKATAMPPEVRYLICKWLIEQYDNYDGPDLQEFYMSKGMDFVCNLVASKYKADEYVEAALELLIDKRWEWFKVYTALNRVISLSKDVFKRIIVLRKGIFTGDYLFFDESEDQASEEDYKKLTELFFNRKVLEGSFQVGG